MTTTTPNVHGAGRTPPGGGRRRLILALGLSTMLLALGVVQSPSAVAAPGPQSLPGVVVASTSWDLRDSLTTGAPTVEFDNFGTTPLVPLTGDWDGDGTSTPGYYKGGSFFLSNQVNGSSLNSPITFGDPRGFPLSGDFDNDGRDDLAVFRGGVWQFRAAATGSLSGTTFGAGTWPGSWPVAGDWDGDGVDGIGLLTLATGSWTLRQASTGGTVIGPFHWWLGATSNPVVGDWDGDGDDTLGIRKGTQWCLDDDIDTGEVTPDCDHNFQFGAAGSFPVVWTRVTHPPDVDNSTGALFYTENDPATAIDTTITITDVDSANLTGATVQVTGNYVIGQDVLGLPAQASITGAFVAATGRLTLSGTASVADYETAFEAVTYVNTSDNPSTLTRTVTYTARDVGGFGTPDTHGVVVVAVDDP